MGRIVSQATKLQLRRLLRRRQRSTEDTLQEVSEQFDKNFIRRFARLKHVRRFTIGWLGLTALLIIATAMQTIGLSGAYQSERPVAGGAFHEGLVGTFSTANPLYATGTVDIAVSRLVFAGLLKYDENNDLVGSLASGYEQNETGKVYTVHLRPHLFWQDGTPLTADDVVFTYNTIKNPDAHSTLIAGMRGVDVEKVDSNTVRFTLSSALATFPNSLTTGIIPQHILAEIPLASLRTARFNTANPVGAGPFKWHQLILDERAGNTSATIALDGFDQYYAGKPRLDRFVIHTYETSDELASAYSQKRIRAAGGLTNASKIFTDDSTTVVHSFQSTAATMVFFNLSSSSPVNDKTVRTSITYGTSRRQIITKLGQTLRTVREPVLAGQFAFDLQYAQPLFDITKANQLLDSAGWTKQPDGIRYKDKHKLTFRLYAEDTPDNRIVTAELKRQWKAIGIAVDVSMQPSIYFQTTLQYRGYDAVLHGISIGTDPDVYAYWHSSQADGNGMNFSNYKSKAADTALEAGRTRQEIAQRNIKYKPFLKAWSEDAPAMPLYRPKFYYPTHGKVYGLNEHIMNTDADRYYSADKWMIRTAFTDNN